MTTVYRIARWADHFENNRTRELKAMSWVPIPNKQDGDGYTELLDHENGAAHFGAWVLIVEIASKCDPRGTLLRDGRSGLRIPHSADSLSRVSRCRAAVFAEAIPRLVAIGWLEIVKPESLKALHLEVSPQESATTPQESATAPQEPALNGREWKGREKKGTEQSTDLAGRPADFEAFYSAYPRKVKPGDALKAWKQTAKIRPPITDVLAGLERCKVSAQWNRDGGKFIDYPATWLRAHGWASEMEPAKRNGSMPNFGQVETSDPESELAMNREYCLTELRLYFGADPPREWSNKIESASTPQEAHTLLKQARKAVANA